MAKVNPEARCITFDDGRTLPFRLQDVNNVFGLPCFGKLLSQGHPGMSDACIEYTRVADSMSDKGTHNIKAAEHFLLRPLSETSSQLDIDCFKIAYVIYAVGHVLSLSSKHNYTTVDYWEALSNISRILEYNWCEYLIAHLMSAVKKLKSDMQTRHTSIHLVGCHFFLQVFLMDNLDLGALTRRQLATNRISLFDYDTLRKMVDALTSAAGGENTFSVKHAFRGDDVGYSCTISRMQEKTPKLKAPTTAKNPSVGTVLSARNGQAQPGSSSNISARNSTRTGPMEFAKYLWETYPDKEDQADCNTLKELNAKIMVCHEMHRQALQDMMFKYAAKYMDYQKSNRCTCGNKGHDLPTRNTFSDKGAQMNTPVFTKPKTLFPDTPEVEGYIRLAPHRGHTLSFPGKAANNLAPSQQTLLIHHHLVMPQAEEG